MTLTQKERVLAQVEHRETDFLPYTLSFEGDSAERLDAYFGGSMWRGLLDNAIRHVPGPELVPSYTGEKYLTDMFGIVWQMDRRPFHLVEPALKEPSLEGYEFPDVVPLFEGCRDAALQAISRQPDYFWVAGFGFGLFERTWTLRGFDNALMDAAGDPGFYAELVEAVARHQLEIIDYLVTLPVDGIWFGDDWGYQEGVILGPDRWRRFLKPWLAEMYARVHEAGKIALSHCCGSIAAILPDVIEIGLDVYESVQPEARGNNPYELKREYGDQITFYGGLGSQSTVPFGTPQEIKSEIARLCREMGEGGGYILAPAKAIQPETPSENAAAVVEAFLEQAGVSL